MMENHSLSLPPDSPSFHEKLELLAYLLEEEDDTASSSVMASLACRPESAPPLASFSQRRFWLLEQLQTEQALYTIPTVYAIDGTLNIALLERSLNQVIERHDVLRTTFVLANEDCTPVSHPPSYHFIPVINLDAIAEEKRMATAIALITDQARKPFNLVTGPLLCTMLVRLKHDAHLLLLAMHHSIADGESVALLLKEMATSYQAYAAGDSPLLPALPLQYADYAYWQRQMLQDPQLETRITAWQRYLATDIPPLELPTDYPPPIETTFRGALLAQEIQYALVEQLRAFSKQQNVTPFMVLLTAFQLLLHRYTEQNTMIVGSPVSGRIHQELEPLLGCFVNTIAIRTELAGNPSFLELLARVYASVLEAYSYQDIPFEKLVESLRLARRQNSSPIFQVMFSYERTETQNIGLDKLVLRPVAIDTGTAKFALTLFIAESENGLTATVEYNTDLFAPATISRLLQHFQRILTIMLAHPEQHIRDFSLLSPQEMALLVSKQKPDVQAQEIRYQSIIQLFEAQAARSPDALALTYEQEMVTYVQLNERANQLAHLLAQSGVGPEIPVALFFERSIDLIISMLAVLKAGGVYVPLDVTSPPERLAFIIQDCGASLVLSTRALLELLPHEHVQVFCLDDLYTSLMALPATNLPCRITAQNLVYCIYTSGSTGTPKGVQVAHVQLLNLLLETQASFASGPDDAWTLFHSPAFDFSVWEIWGALLSGGRLVIIPYWVTRSPQELWALLLQQGITILNQTPSALRQLLLYADIQAAARTTALRLVILGGEALNVASLHPWFEGWGEHGPALVNMYGITETTVHVTQRRLQQQNLLSPSHSPLGQSLNNMQIYLLDPYMQPVPIGVTGEIYVGGAGLARGYLHLPDLTAERFVPNPFVGIFHDEAGSHDQSGSYGASEPGARLYKSGDLARLLPSGELVYQGRIDHQVKIRGFRVELGEIEQVLCRHPAIREAVVRVAGADSTERHLVAYLVISPGEEAQVTAQRMRDYLSARLPDYMLPVAYVVLERLPMTANNKIDYQALPAPERQLPASDQPFVAPQTINEQILAEIWQQVLGVERVGLDDNFFALGGDSIRSIQVLARARQRGLHFSLQQLFQQQTVYALSRVLQVGTVPGGCPTPDNCPPFSLLSDVDRAKLPSGLVDAYPLTMLQAGMLYHMQLHPDTPLYHNVFSLHIKAPFDREGLRQAVQQVAERHAILRTSFDLTTFSEPLQLVHRSVSFPITYNDLSHLTEDEQEKRIAQFIAEEERRLFDLSVPPLLRFHIQRRSESSFQFTLTENHAILDGWSLMSTLAEIFDLHSAFLRDQNLPQLAPLAASFSDFVAYERQVLQSDAHRHYWQQKLQGYSFNLLAGNVSSAAPDQQCYSLEYAVPHDIYQGLRGLAAEVSVPLKSVLLAAHVKVMSVMSGQSDVLTGLTSEGRPEQEDGEAVRGLFLNVVPLRQQLQHCSWSHLIKTTFMTEVELLPFRHYPLAAIQRDAGGAILFETLFTYLHFHAVAHLARQQNFAILDTKRSEKNNFAVNASFMLDPLHDRLSLQLDLDATRFSKAQCEALAYCYRQVLRTMVDDPHQDHAAQSFLSSDELQKILINWNQPQTLLPRRACLHQLFAEQAARTPDAPALISPELTLTYQQLDQQANQLAHFLQAMQVGPDVPVAIYLERSPALIICMLGILKAGGAYVPFDTRTPPQRLCRMLEDAQATILFTQESLQPSLPDAPLHTIYVEQAWSQLARFQGEAAPTSAVQPENLAYIIYTSGSSGEPKGVMIPHTGLVNYVTWAAEAYAVAKNDGSPLHTSPGFDLTVTSIFPALIVGKPVILLAEHHTVEDLLPLLYERSCSPLKLTPAHLALLNQLLDAEPASAVDKKLHPQVFVVGGEALTAELLLPWLRQEPESKFINEYGPTEASVGCCIYQVSGDREHTSAIPIGRPIAHTQLYVLDAFMQPVPQGVAGELYIGGPGLARGYLRAPDLTAERFLPNPFVGTLLAERLSAASCESSVVARNFKKRFIASGASEPGMRLYKTGDMARLLPCGELEFLGRVDQQVKIRGFRIEPAEVAAQVMRHPSVQDSIVVCREIRAGEKQLIAYLSLRPGYTFDEDALRSFLGANLPDYMLPAAYILLEKLPLTAQGKIDRAALPLPDEIAPRRPVAFLAPATPLEQLIANIWSDVLQREEIGTLDNFFALGGHSLSAMQVVSRLRTDLQVELPLRTFLEYPTIAELIAVLCQDDEQRERLEKIALVFKMVIELSDDEVRSMLHTRNFLNEGQ